MANVFGTSVGLSKILCSHRWVVCISHRFNDVMKAVIESTEMRENKGRYFLY